MKQFAGSLINSKMAYQRIIDCLAAMEDLCGTRDDEHDSIPDRIQRIACEVNSEHQYRVNLWLLWEHPNEQTYQQMLYHLIPWMDLSQKYNETELTKMLVGENNEYLFDCECLYTDELYNNIYETIVTEHMHNWREFYFDEAELEGVDLVSHLEYVAYAKEHGL